MREFGNVLFGKNNLITSREKLEILNLEVHAELLCSGPHFN
jgi:hypothetical protein